MNKMTIRFYHFLWICIAVFFAAACSNDIEQEQKAEHTGTLLKAQLETFKVDGRNASLPGEENINDIKACLFENGTLTQIYSDFGKEENRYTLNINKNKGNLYILANTGEVIDLQGMADSGITEEEWLNTSIQTEQGKALEFLSTKINLDNEVQKTYTVNTSLKRGVARFDLLLRTESPIAVQRVTLKNIAQQGYLFAKEEIASPDGTKTQDLTVDFSEPAQTDVQGIAYVYEQASTEPKVEISMMVNGMPITKEASLPSVLKRNAVYTLTLRKDMLTANIQLDVQEWEAGGDYNLAPSNETVTVDLDESTLPENVVVNAERNKISFPYTASEITLAVDCDDELEFIPTENMPFTVESLGGTSAETFGKNLFKIRKERWRLGVAGQTVKMQFQRKGMKETYPDDYLTIVLPENPTKIEGLFSFIDSYTFDFGKYIDNEYGVLTIPDSKSIAVEYEDGEDAWVKLSPREDNPNAFRVLGGWKPNDPTANGREQRATIVISNKADGSDVEKYTIVRRNWGLPVVYQQGLWWCKYNAMGDSKNFSDQILSSNDPAAKAGKTLYDYLRDCTAEEFYNLWKWQYQGKSSMGMQVIDDNGTAKLEGYSSSSVHINKIDPKTLAPDGYEIPSMEEYERIFLASDYVWLMWDGTHKTPWNGGSNIQRRQRRRNDITIGSVTLTDLIYIAMHNNAYSEKDAIVWYGPGAQWDNNGIKHNGHYNNMLFAVYSPGNGQGWFFNGGMGNLFLTKNGAGSSDSRILRFKKSPVEYIYE